MKNVDVYKMMVVVKGTVIYRIILENDETKDDISKETVKRVIDKYNTYGGLLEWSEPNIVESDIENEFYSFVDITLSHSSYVTVIDDEDLFIKSIEKFKEEIPDGIQNINEIKINVLEKHEDNDHRMAQMVDVLESYFDKGEDQHD
jgi:hypothetical protein